MAAVDNEQEKKGQTGGGSAALKAAAAAAATGAAALAARRALSGDGHKSSEREEEEGRGDRKRGEREDSGSVLASIFSGGWDAARDALIPVAEDAASAAGKYLAQSGPEIVRERIVPRFISSFNAAQE